MGTLCIERLTYPSSRRTAYLGVFYFSQFSLDMTLDINSLGREVSRRQICFDTVSFVPGKTSQSSIASHTVEAKAQNGTGDQAEP